MGAALSSGQENDTESVVCPGVGTTRMLVSGGVDDLVSHQGSGLVRPVLLTGPYRCVKTLREGLHCTGVVMVVVCDEDEFYRAAVQDLGHRFGMRISTFGKPRVHYHRRVRSGGCDDIRVGTAERHPGRIVLGNSGCELATSHDG